MSHPRIAAKNFFLLALPAALILILSLALSSAAAGAMPATGDAAQPGGVTEDPPEEEPPEEEPSADLQIRLFGPVNGEIPAGADLTYTIVVDNLGPDEVDGVVLRGLLNSDNLFELHSLSSDRTAACTPAPGNYIGALDIRCTLASPLEAMSAQQDGRWLVTVVLRASKQQSISALATVRGDLFDPDLSNNEATARHQISELADLSITKSASGENLLSGCPAQFAPLPNQVNAGGHLSYEIMVTNAGPSRATNVVVRDQLPAGFTFGAVTTGSGSCQVDLDEGMLTCGLGAIEEGSAVTITVDGLVGAGVSDGHLLISNALVTAATYDDYNGNDIANNVTTVHQSTDLALAMTASGEVVTGWDDDSETPIVQKLSDQVSAGSRLQYSYTIHNNGLAPVNDAQLQSRLPFTPDQISGATCAADESDPTLTVCTAASVPAGGDRLVVLSGLTAGTLANGSVINNETAVASPIVDTCADNDSAANMASVLTTADLSLEVHADPPPAVAGANGRRQGLVEVTPGSPNRYMLTAGSNGPSAAAGPQLEAQLTTMDSGAPGERLLGCEPIAPLTAVTCVFEAPDVVRVTSMAAGKEIIIAPGGGRISAGAAYSFYLNTEVARDFLQDEESGMLTLSAAVRSATTDYRLTNNAAGASVDVVLGAVSFMPFTPN